MNGRAAALRNRQMYRTSTYRVTDEHLTEYRPVTQNAVKNALWIAEYGFADQTFMDGAYYRMVMLGELSRASLVYVARPVRFTCYQPDAPGPFRGQGHHCVIDW